MPTPTLRIGSNDYDISNGYDLVFSRTVDFLVLRNCQTKHLCFQSPPWNGFLKILPSLSENNVGWSNGNNLKKIEIVLGSRSMRRLITK